MQRDSSSCRRYRGLYIIIAALMLIGLWGSSQMAMAQITLPCCTDFDDNDQHGYTYCPFAPNVQFDLRTPGPSGDPSDIYLWAKDLANASAICAGHDCDGDWTALAATGCGALCYDYRFLEDGCPADPVPCSLGYAFIKPSVTIWRLISPTDSIGATFVPNFYITDDDGTNGGWHHICAPIAPVMAGQLPGNTYGQWQMRDGRPNSDWDLLLQDVGRMVFPIDPTANPAEEVGLDNICLRDDECPGIIPTLTEWGLIIFGALLLGWMAYVVVRRRRGVTVGI